MADDSMADMLKRLKEMKPGMTDPDMTDLIQPDQMQEILGREADADRMAKDIQSRMNAKNMAQSAKEGADEFAAKYADKMKVPAGMKLGDIPDETARLGMKNPLRKGAIAKLAGKIGGKALKGGAGLASLFMQDELNPEGEPIEDPSIPADIRGRAAMEAMQANQEQMAQDADFEERSNAREDRIAALKAKLRAEAESGR